MKTLMLLCTAALALSGCRTDGPTKEEPAAAPLTTPIPSVGKPQAPVDITADVATASATVRLRFGSAASNVEVRVNGVDGLVIPGEAVLASGRAFAAGETATFEVRLAPGPGQGMLAVQVSGTFPGGTRSATRAFVVGKPSADQQLRSSDAPIPTVGGEPVKVMPVTPKQ